MVETQCQECGADLPYGGHVATPLCDACLDPPPLILKASGLRLERCAGSGDLAQGHGHLCPCGQIFSAPAGAEGGPWPIPEHDGECSW